MPMKCTRKFLVVLFIIRHLNKAENKILVTGSMHKQDYRKCCYIPRNSSPEMKSIIIINIT